jgi:hypothetical protein
MMGSISEILKLFLSSGAFSPEANKGIMDATRERALGDAEANRQHAQLVAQSLGTDPATAASYALRSDLGSQGDVSKALSDASYGEATHQRDFGQQLLMGLLGIQGQQNSYKPGKSGFDYLNELARTAGGFYGKP